MTQIGESVSVNNLSSEDKPVKCEWTECKTTHLTKPQYSNEGTVERNTTFKDDWVSEKLEPWALFGPGKDTQPTYNEYKEETPGANYLAAASAMTHPEYHTQKHHLISINLFGGVKKLSKNAELIGYDVNHKNNGSCFPSYIVDIVRHDLQCHRGSHPKPLYNDKLKPLLANIERRCLSYCEMDINGDGRRQDDLIDDLNRLSSRAYRKIKSYDWLLRKNAFIEKADSERRYKNLK